MPPRRPPPLSLFDSSGHLKPLVSTVTKPQKANTRSTLSLYKDFPDATVPGPARPHPTGVHPKCIADAHSFPNEDGTDSLFDGLPESYPKPPINHVVQVKMNVSAGPAKSVHGVKPFSIHPTILNLTLVTPPSITNIAKGAVDIIVPSTQPMTLREWDLLEEAVNALDGSWGAPENQSGGGKIVISGILPPPLTKQSVQLPRDELYDLHLARLARLSLHANVFLKVLPPVVESKVETWYDDKKELDRVIKMYLSPAIEAFGFHRIVFGSSPALPGPHLGRRTRPSVDLIYPYPSSEWYNALRRCLTELGIDAESVTKIMCDNARKVYQLGDEPVHRPLHTSADIAAAARELAEEE